MITEQEHLILSFFDRDIPKEMNDSDLTSEMQEAGIGVNSASRYQYYQIGNQLVNKDLLEYYQDAAKNKKVVLGFVDQTLYVLSENAVHILQRKTEKSKQDIFVTELEFSKLKNEQELLTKQLDDYNKTKQKSNFSLIVSIIATIVAIIALFVK